VHQLMIFPIINFSMIGLSHFLLPSYIFYFLMLFLTALYWLNAMY